MPRTLQGVQTNEKNCKKNSSQNSKKSKIINRGYFTSQRIIPFERFFRPLSKREAERKANLFSYLTACDFCLPYWVCQKTTRWYLAKNCLFFVSLLVSKEVFFILQKKLLTILAFHEMYEIVQVKLYGGKYHGKEITTT
jgi:hypothetical protein